jgi:hypothetical protein
VASRTFTLFHLSLVPRAEPRFDTFTGSREDWLRYALQDGFSFPHRGGGELHWVPQQTIDESILGLLQKTRKHARHRSPSEGGEEIIEDEWQGAYVLIDPTHHDEGQRVAIENDVVGESKSLLKSLVNAINSWEVSGYHTEIEPLFDGKAFWDFAEEHGSLLRYIRFNFVVPNMWQPYNDLDEDLKDIGNENGSQRVGIDFSSEDGVVASTPRIRRGVDYAERGAGTLRARSMDGATFRSTNKLKTTMVPFVAGAATVALFVSLKERILGRAQGRSLDDTRSDSGDVNLD